MKLFICVFICIFIGFILAYFSDRYFLKKYSYPTLSIFLAYLYKSKNFKWLTINVWGNDNWYFEKIILKNKLNK